MKPKRFRTQTNALETDHETDNPSRSVTHGSRDFFVRNNLVTCFKTLKEIEIKQQDKYCTVKEMIQFRPATFDELRRQLDLRSDSLGAEMKSNDAGYVHAKDNNRKVSSDHMID